MILYYKTNAFFAKLYLYILAILGAMTVFAVDNNRLFFASNQTFSSSYEIKNSFDKILKLGKIRASCTCADVKYLKSELLPGESTELIVTLKANSLSGPFSHTIYVETDNPEQRFMRFVMKGNAIPL